MVNYASGSMMIKINAGVSKTVLFDYNLTKRLEKFPRKHKTE